MLKNNTLYKTYLCTFYSILIFLLPLFISNSYGQKSNNIDTTLAEKYYQKALVFQDSALLDSAIFYNKEAISLFNKNVSKKLLVEREYKYDSLLTHFYINKKEYSSAKKSIAEMLEMYTDSVDLSSIYMYKGTVFEREHALTQAIYNYKKAISLHENHEKYLILGRTYVFLGKFKEGQKFIHIGLQRLLNQTTYDPKLLIRYYGELGVSYGYDGRYQKAIYYYNKGLALTKKELGKNNRLYRTFINNLGVCQEKLGNYQKALEYYQTAFILSKGTDGNMKPESALWCSNIGTTFIALGQTEKAIDKYEEAISILNKHNPDNHAALVEMKINLGNAHLKVNNYLKAVDILSPNLDSARIVLGLNSPPIEWALSGLAYCYQNLGQLSKAKKYHQEALDFSLKNFGESHPQIATTLNNYAETLYENREFDLAISKVQQAIWIQDKTCSKIDFRENPKKFNVFEPLTLLKTLDKKAYYIYKAYSLDTSNIEYLEISYNTYLSTLELGDQIFQSFDRDESKLKLLEQIVEIHTRAVEVATAYLNHNSGLDNVRSNLFAFIENSRASVLQEALYLKEVELATVPDSVLLTGRELKSKIDELKLQLIEDDLDDVQRNQISKDLVQLNLQHDSILSQMLLNYPAYQLALGKSHHTKMQSVQERLDKDETLIEYFLSDSILYTIALTDSSFNIYQQPNDATIKNLLQSFQKNLYTYHLSTKNGETFSYENNLKELATSGTELYNLLLKPIEKLSEKLIIIPDGELGYIPFDVLLSEFPDLNDPLNTWEFLIKKHQISYGYSASLWLEMKEKISNKGELIAFAPLFNSTDTPTFASINELRREGLGPLIFNQKEVNNIATITNGRALTNEEANVENFYAQAPNAGILHFATHAKLDDSNSEYSWLAMQPSVSGTEKDKIFVKDLYRMNLSPDMVVLSACETGFGELKKGEGIFSLARGFAYAGAKSIITSLWAVNDYSTYQLMIDFYKNLKLGQSKDAALRNAKLNYLNTVDNFNAHPFYWGSFIGIGDMTPLSFNIQRNTLKNYLLVLGSLLGIFIIIRWQGARKG